MATIVLVVGSTGTLSNGDIVVQDRLVAAGHTVVLRNDEDAEYTGSYDGLFVADSSSGGTFGAKYDTVAKPGITAENASWRLGSFLGGIDGTQWTVENVTGNGGFTGTHTVYSTTVSQQGIDTDVLPGGATVVARLAGDADQGVYVTYASGGALTSGTAPAKRVFLRIPNAGAPNLTATGTALLDAAISWAFAVPGTIFTKTGGGAALGAASGAKSVVAANFVNKAGGAASSGAGSGAKAIGRAHAKAGGGAALGASSGAKVVDNVPPAQLPSDVLDLSYWHLTTPEDSGDGDAEQIDQPELDDFESAGFFVDEDGFVTFIADVNGFTTSGASGSTRMELRQHEKGSYVNSAWNPNTTGRRQMTVTTRVNAEPITGGSTPREEAVCAQIHGAGDSPIPLILAAEYHVSPARIRIYKNGPGFANPVTSITSTTAITIRIRVEDARLQVWAIAGERTDLPDPVTTTAPYDWPISDFTDDEGWYFKVGIYNKTQITSGSTGQSVARISYLNVLAPTDDEEQSSTTYEKTGGAASSRAGSGAKTFDEHEVHAETGGAARVNAGSGAKTVTSATVYVESGGVAAGAAGSGSVALVSATVHAEAGGGAARGAAAGSDVLTSATVHAKTGGATSSRAGAGARERARSYGGGAATPLTGAGAKSTASATTYVKAGGAAALGAASGHQEESVVHARTGGGALTSASAGGLELYQPTTYDRTGGAAAPLTGAGGSDVQPATVHDRTGGAAARGVAGGARQRTSSRAGGASSVLAAGGADEYVLPAVHTLSGGAAARSAGAGDHEHDGPAGHAKDGGGVALGAASGAQDITSPVVYEKTGGAAALAAGLCLVEVIPAADYALTGGAALVGAGSGRRRVGGRMHAAVPVIIGQFRAGTPVRR